MSKGIKPVNYTYGVGMEFVATTGKQVKDELKSNLDGLSKLIKQYNEVLKVDPDADLSKLFNEMKKLQNVVSGINNSGNAFSDFVDKGVLDRVAKLETRLESISSTSDVVKKDLAELKTSMSLITDAFKSVGQTKFPATFDNLFGDIKDQSAEIQKVTDQIKTANTAIAKLQESLQRYRVSNDSKLKSDFGIEHVKTWLQEWRQIQDELSSGKKLNTQELYNKVLQLSTLGQKINAAQNTFPDEMFDTEGLTQQINLFNNQSSIISKRINAVITQLSNSRQKLNEQLEGLNADQAKYKAKMSTSVSSGKSLGVQSDYTAQVKVNPKTNEAEWIAKINDTIHNIEGQLDKVRLTPTFSKNAPNMEKEIDGSLAQINHAINVDLKVTDSVADFEKEIARIDKSIKSAKAQLEKNTSFQIKFEYEDGGKFKDKIYSIINPLKKIESRFYIVNGKKFISDVTGLRDKAKNEMKRIFAEVAIGNEEEVLSSISSLRSKIDEKIGNIGVNLTLQNIPQFMAQAALMKDDVTKAISTPSNVAIGTEDATKSIVELSEKAKKAQEDIEKIKSALRSLTEVGFKSPDFLKLGAFDQDFKYIKGSKEQIKQILQGYEELVTKTQGTKEQILATYGTGEVGFNAYQQDLMMLEQAENALNTILQSQIQYAQHRLELAQNTLEQEKKIASTKKEQPSSTTTTEAAQVKVNKELSMSAEEATKKIRSLNGTLTQQKRALKDLETNGIHASSFVRLGEWDKESGSFKKNSQDIQQLINRYKELKQARENAGGVKVVGEEASIRGKLGAILTQQKKHMSELITKNQEELSSVKNLASEYKKVSDNKVKATKTKDTGSLKHLNELISKLNKAKKTLKLLQSEKFDALGSTGLGDVNKRLETAGSKQSFEELIAYYNKLIAKRDELEKAGQTGSAEYISYAKAYQMIEQQLSVIYKDQLKYCQTRIGQLDTEIQKEKEILRLKKEQKETEPTQSSKQNTNKTTNTGVNNTSSVVKLDGTSLNTLAKDATLKAIDGKINNILTQLGNGVVINGSNISIEASNVSVSGKGTSVNGGAKSKKTPPGEKEVQLTTISSYSQQLIALEERIKRTGLYTDDLKEKFANLNAQLNAIRIKDDADAYKFDLDRFKEDFEQLKTYDQLYQDLIKSQTKQVRINDQIATSNGPTAELQEQLKLEAEKSKKIEEQLSKYTTLYNNRARQLVMEEAIKNANQEIAQSIAAQSDKNITKQNNELAKIVDDAQKKLDDMQYSMQNSKVPMADAAIAKFKQYEQLLTTLKTKQAEVAANPDLLQDQGYKSGFDSLLQQMKDVEGEFGTLQKSSENFLNKIKSIDDIKPLDSVFDATNLDQLHSSMQEFADQVGAGSAKLIEFHDSERTATFEVQKGQGQVQQLTVAYDEATNSLGRYINKTKTSTSETQKFLQSIKHSFQNVVRYVASFGSVYRLFAIIKQGFTYVKDIDGALTELKKVTDETDATYDAFLQTMSKTAAVVGSTTSELTTMAADYNNSPIIQ